MASLILSDIELARHFQRLGKYFHKTSNMSVEIDNFDLPQTPSDLEAKGGINALKQKLVESAAWRSTPFLNYTPLHQLKDLTLVRFRGMIQDMSDPEVYLERYEVTTSAGETRIQQGKYRDCLVTKTNEEVNYSSKNNLHGERRTFFVVSLPGQNEWSMEYEKKCTDFNIASSFRIQKAVYPESSNNVKKRSAPTDDSDINMDVDVDAGDETAGKNIDGVSKSEFNKRKCLEEKQEKRRKEKSELLSLEYLINSPIPERPSMACIIKIYEGFESYMLNDFIDVIGFLSVDPSLDASMMDVEIYEGLSSINELRAQNPPPSLIPRLHAIAIRKLPHANPLLDHSLHHPVKAMEPLLMPSVQKDLHTFLTLCTFNDEIAAEYLLSHLISKVYNRTEMQCLGKFTLNICNIPKECLEYYSVKLYDIIALLLPASHYLPLTLDIMNTVTFVPKKDYETNKLISGILQLAPHTHLVLDETRMQQGKLESNGVSNVNHLANLINNQQFRCDFQYYEIDYDVNIPILILSEGISMLPSDFSVPLITDAKSVNLIRETIEAANDYLQQPERLDQFRRYLTMARISNFNVNEEHTQMIQNDFIELRKKNLMNNVNDLHCLLVLARLLAIGRGKEEFDVDSWSLAKELEIKRYQRVQALPKSSFKKI